MCQVVDRGPRRAASRHLVGHREHKARTRCVYCYADPAFETVGVWVSREHNVGRTAGELRVGGQRPDSEG